jgi:catechol 2,3-dioxygenase-like lactoylglutathione lyase family enzyme/diadenosine tetraphosphate (Ap4A) HIT family hydrolase
MPTAIHRRVAACRAGTDPTFIARLPSGWAVMGDPQVLEGYCLLLPDPVVPHLNALSPVDRDQFLSDMARLGDAVSAATRALRINYAMFGNVEPALHAHVFPRFDDEPAALRTAHPWRYDWAAARPFDSSTDNELLQRIRDHLLSSSGPSLQAPAPFPDSSAYSLKPAAYSLPSGSLHHVDLTVSDLEHSTRFYDSWLPYVGFQRIEDCAEGPLWRGERFELGLQAAKPEYRAHPHNRHAPGLHHLAFEAPSIAAVDRLYATLQELGLVILDPPARYEHYAPGYYAVFFADPDGIKLEYVYTPA